MEAKEGISQFVLKSMIRIVAGATIGVYIGIEKLNLKSPLTEHHGFSEKGATILICVVAIVLVVLFYDILLKPLRSWLKNRPTGDNLVEEGGHFHTTRHIRKGTKIS